MTTIKFFLTDKNDQKSLFELYICIISKLWLGGVLKLGKKFVGAQFDLVSSLRAKYDVVVVVVVNIIIFSPGPASYCIAL